MHIVIHEYEDGTRYVFETDHHGKSIQDVEGGRQPGKRIRAVLDMLCDDNKEGGDTLLRALDSGKQLVNGRFP